MTREKTFLTTRERVTNSERRHNFDDPAVPGAGWSFPLDAEGLPVITNEGARLNWAKCQQGVLDGTVIDRGIDTLYWTHTEYASIRCYAGRCRRQVWLTGFTNTCDCGADYNMSGDLLAPRSQWGEETGESLSDILSIE